MLPLDTVFAEQETEGGSYRPVLKTPKKLNDALRKLREAGVTGVMVDVWWGIVEADAPGTYNFDAYLELLRMAALNGLKVQAVMSFHAAGGNVGDNVNIPLPDWVLQVMRFSYSFSSPTCHEAPHARSFLSISRPGRKQQKPPNDRKIKIINEEEGSNERPRH